MTTIAPTAPRERLAVLDVLRGLALLGVLLGNSFRLYSGEWAGWHVSPQPGPLDVAAAWFINVVVQSKAQTLLTFLFGLGFAQQLIRAEDRGEPVLGLYTRRLVALAGLGALHLLVWWGDVLWTYAFAGFFLLFFLRASNRTRLIAAIFFLFVPGALMRIPGARPFVYSWLLEPGSFPIYTQALLDAMRGDSYGEVLRHQIPYAVVFSAGGWVQYEPWLLGRFLLGYIVGARRWFERDGADHLPVFRRLLRWGLILGGLGSAMTISRMAGAWDAAERTVPLGIVMGVFNELDFLGLATVAVAATVLLMQRPGWRRLLLVVAPAGRMPVTVYLSQSVIMTSLVYGWGLGWIEILPPAAYVGLAFAVFAVQVIFCRMWLRWFRLGPLEWVWRTIVYLRRPAMRNESSGKNASVKR